MNQPSAGGVEHLDEIDEIDEIDGNDEIDGTDDVGAADTDAPGEGGERSADVDVAADEPGPDGDGTLPAVLAARLADPAELAAAIEAILFVQDNPVSVASLAVALQQTTDAVGDAVERLRAGYDERRSGLELREVAGGVRLYTRAEHADVVEHFLRDGQRTRLSQAALETLAVIAYRQPVTRARVSAIRGVNVDGVVRTLLARGLIVEVGADPETGGGLFRTTDLFLERMGLQSLEQLPSLAPLLPDVEAIDALAADDL